MEEYTCASKDLICIDLKIHSSFNTGSVNSLFKTFEILRMVLQYYFVAMDQYVQGLKVFMLLIPEQAVL